MREEPVAAPTARYLIWSEEHGGWWLAGERGYTRSIAEAGRYSIARGEEVVAAANQYGGGPMREILVRAPEDGL